MLIIDLIQGPSVFGTYAEIWRAAVAIDAMCVRRGLPGWAIKLVERQDPRMLLDFGRRRQIT